MKKIVILTLATAALTACGVQGRKTAAAKEPGKAETAETTGAPTRLAIGAYTDQRPLTEEDKELFDTVTKGLLGVGYTPESVATQVVAGTNYRFVCAARTVTAKPDTFRAEITVFKPLPGRGEAHITQIRRL